MVSGSLQNAREVSLQNASKGSLRNAEPVLNWITDLEVLCHHKRFVSIWVLTTGEKIHISHPLTPSSLVPAPKTLNGCVSKWALNSVWKRPEIAVFGSDPKAVFGSDPGTILNGYYNDCIGPIECWYNIYQPSLDRSYFNPFWKMFPFLLLVLEFQYPPKVVQVFFLGARIYISIYFIYCACTPQLFETLFWPCKVVALCKRHSWHD